MKIDYTRYYSRWHPDTAKHRAATEAYYRRLLEGHLPQDRAARILDVGCGFGLAMLTLRSMGYATVSGIDCDEGQVAKAKSNGLDVQLIEDTVAHLRSKPGDRQVILALDVIEHIPVGAQLEFAGALATALAPGGRLICTVPNANSALAGRWRYNDWTHHSSFTECSLDFLLFNAGFVDVKILSAEFLWRPQNYWIPFLSGARHWWAFRFFRFWRRLECMAELGPEQGRTVPLSLNLLGVAKKQ